MSSPLFTPASSPSSTAIDEDSATLQVPDIPGLFYIADFFSGEEAEHIIESIIEQGYFDVELGRNQAVLFGSRDCNGDGGLPEWTREFLSLVALRLKEQERIPTEILELLFPPKRSDRISPPYTRQLILNCYQPGQGISSHIDLPHQFLDGIMIFSFGSSIAMDFEHASNSSAKHSIYLLPSSLCVLSGESRWHWKHGIEPREGDYVRNSNKEGKQYMKRGQRLSITVRWYRLDGEANNDKYQTSKEKENDIDYRSEQM